MLYFTVRIFGQTSLSKRWIDYPINCEETQDIYNHEVEGRAGSGLTVGGERGCGGEA